MTYHPGTTFTVRSSWGFYVACSRTGLVLESRITDPDPELMPEIIRFDVAEWECTYPGEDICTHDVDILDLGNYWRFTEYQRTFFGSSHDEDYDPPCFDWRLEPRYFAPLDNPADPVVPAPAPAEDEQRRATIIAMARDQYADEGTFEVDDDARVSEGDDNGAYVQVWVWVGFDDSPLDKA